MLRPDGALLGFFGTAQPRDARYTKYIIVDEVESEAPSYPAARGRQAILLNRDIIRLFGGLARLRLVPAAEQPARDSVPKARLANVAVSLPRRWRAPVIALLTDFGLRDHYVGTMKGVILGICPDATLVDISHDLPPHDVLAGALELGAVVPVLSRRHDLSRRRRSGRRLGAAGHCAPRAATTGSSPPTTACSRWSSTSMPPTRVVELTERRYARPTVSRTFEGRDRFAPAAAWLATGVDLGALGRAAGPLHAARRCPSRWSSRGRFVGEVLRVDRFGNLITNIDRRTFDASVGRVARDPVGGHRGDAESSRPTPTSRPATSARSSAAPIISRSRSTARAPPRCFESGTRRARARRAARVIA